MSILEDCFCFVDNDDVTIEGGVYNMYKFVKIKSNGSEFVQHVPKSWNNSRIREELGDIFPIDSIKQMAKKDVPKSEVNY